MPQENESPKFRSLVAALEPWFGKPSVELPDDLKQLVEVEFHGRWDKMDAEGRRKAALWRDYQHDPATETERERYEKVIAEKWEIEREIRELELTNARTAEGRESKNRQLAEKRRQLSEINSILKKGLPQDGLTIEIAAEAIAAKYGWHTGASDSLKERLVEAAKIGMLTVRDPHTDLPYRPTTIRPFYDLVTAADVDAYLEKAGASYRLGDGPEATAVLQDAERDNGPLHEFRSMHNLTADELSITFAPDNMLEITVREVTRRVPLASLDLVNRVTGGLNRKGDFLLRMAKGERFTRTDSNAQGISRLRRTFREQLGIQADPFHEYRKGAGWEPRFKVRDNRHAADERAERNARHVTLDDADEDAVARWLRDNDPESPL